MANSDMELAKKQGRRFKRVLLVFLSLSPALFVSCGKSQPAVFQNITLDPSTDPYQAANFEEEYNFFASKLKRNTLQKVSDIDDPYTQKPVFLPPPQLSSEQEEKLNQLAKKVDQPLIKEAIGRGFSTPTVDSEGRITGFRPSIFLPLKSVPAPGLQQPYQNGLARIVPNQTYQQLFKRVYALALINENLGVSGGTAWLLDYKLNPDNTPPNHFFFVTNAHVWINFFHRNDAGGPYGNREFEQETKFISLTHLLPNQAPPNTKLPTTFDKKVFAEVLLNPQEAKIRTVFMGLDFLKSSPSDWTEDPNWKNSEEMADIAVFEVVFTPESLRGYTSTFNLTFEEALEQITGSYHKLPASQKFNLFDSTQFFASPTPFLSKNVFALAYPTSKFDESIDPVKDGELASKQLLSRSLWTNKPKDLWNQTLEDSRWRGGWGFSASRSYRSFMHKPGVIDLTVIAPNLSYLNGNSLFFELRCKNNQRRRFIHYGLAFVLDDFSAPSGSSGGLVINSNYEYLGVHTASDTVASVGLVTALNSPGFNYSGYYGKYNLEAYDLIYGGHENQKFSYKQALAQLYSPEFSTSIFPNGVK